MIVSDICSIDDSVQQQQKNCWGNLTKLPMGTIVLGSNQETYLGPLMALPDLNTGISEYTKGIVWLVI